MYNSTEKSFSIEEIGWEYWTSCEKPKKVSRATQYKCKFDNLQIQKAQPACTRLNKFKQPCITPHNPRRNSTFPDHS